MRKCADWLATYMQYTEQAESPDKYHYWSGLSMIAATLRRQVWVNMGYFKVYPNMYIVLVGPAGARKTAAIRIGTNLLSELTDIRVSADSTTREALIRALKDSNIETTIDGVTPYHHSSLTIVSEELSVFLGTQNHDLLSVLTNLYDCKDIWEYRTKGSGVDTIAGVWLNLLGATTPDWLVGSIPLTAIGGGFTSRILFVVEDGPRKKTAIPFLTKEELILKNDLLTDLVEIAKLRGEFKFSPEGRKWFIQWYENKDDLLAKDPRFAGYSERKHIHLLKTAVLISACKGNNMLLTDEHLTLALALIDNLETKMVHAFGSTGRSLMAPDIDMILTYINNFGSISRGQLLNSVWRDVNPKDIDVVIKTLCEMGQITQILKNNTIYYEKKEA